jgi:hypothetical protein
MRIVGVGVPKGHGHYSYRTRWSRRTVQIVLTAESRTYATQICSLSEFPMIIGTRLALPFSKPFPKPVPALENCSAYVPRQAYSGDVRWVFPQAVRRARRALLPMFLWFLSPLTFVQAEQHDRSEAHRSKESSQYLSVPISSAAEFMLARSQPCYNLPGDTCRSHHHYLNVLI